MIGEDENNRVLGCSFCGRTMDEVRKLIAKMEAKAEEHEQKNDKQSSKVNVSICDICIERCVNLMQKENIYRSINKDNQMMTPKTIRLNLDQYVEGQEKAKITLSVAIYNHYQRIKYNKTHRAKDDVQIEKSNIMMLGPSGSGKTFLIKTIANLLSVPFITADAKTLTEAGYVGEDVESLLAQLLNAAEGDVEKAEKGIIYIDEIDKIAKKDSSSISRDISGEGVQQALLTMLEGRLVNVPLGGKKNFQQETVQINTSNILFICGGAFPELIKIIQKRLKPKVYGISEKLIDINEINEQDHELMESVNNDDFEKFGFIKEFTNRFSIIINLQELSEEQLFQVMKNKKQSLIKQFQATYSSSNASLNFTDDAIRAIVKYAIKQKSGVRGLRRIIEKILNENMYHTFSEDKAGEGTILIDAAEVHQRMSNPFSSISASATA